MTSQANCCKEFEVLLQFEFAKGENGVYQAAYRLCNSSMGWIFVNGSFTAPMKDFSSARLLVRGLDVGVKYLMDNVSLHEVPENVNWFGEANANIDKYRKSNANMRFILPAGVRQSDFDVQVKLKRHQFAFGSLIKDTLITATPATAYSQLVYHMFNWATVQSYKWKFDKGTLRRPDYSVALQATDVLNSHGLKVRGHSIFFDFAKNNPKNIVKLGSRSLQKEMDKHLMYMCNITFGKLAHWDVQNEHIRGQYYEETRKDTEVTKNIFRQVKQLVNNTKLYFNDVMGVLSGASTEGLTQLMKQYLSEGVPVDGLGIQGHSKPYIKPDPTMIWRRLDRLAMTQLELFITEFDVLTPE
ncbi:uncharacterized protein LOC112554387 [Pomacea canaliculata]|uniref:uncharacterized protein LOC112554387 n=1 Tax=Pomacea canaliculata TaxID=400727 RepID=UPI000D73B2EB|nr:uncharacterized protein LOC112554387 [Pomacea canaliculata]